jgi:predicted nucleotide-binding protein
MEQLIVRLAEPNDYKNLSEFRIRQFEDNDEFILKDSKLLSQQQGVIFIAEVADTKQIVSTMQVEHMFSPDHFLKLYSSYYRIKPDPRFYPSYYISKVATAKHLRNRGLNSYLRLQVLKIAKDRKDIYTLTGIVFEGGPRVDLMKKLGYKSCDVQIEKEAYLDSKVETQFMWLEKKEFSNAIALLKNQLLSNEIKYKIVNQFYPADFLTDKYETPTRIFIGSSKEKEEFAEKIKEKLSRMLGPSEIELWSDYFFENNKSALESIVEKADSFDFAILLLTGDDRTESRNESFTSLRDNIVFEFGYFMGTIGRNRTFGILDKKVENHILSDLRGISMPVLEYDFELVDDSLTKLCESLYISMNKVGRSRSRDKDYGQILKGFDYERFARQIKHCKENLKILITYLYPFTENRNFSYIKNDIISNLNYVINNHPNVKIEFLFLNPFSLGMDVRIKDRENTNRSIPGDLVQTYGFLYDLKYNPKYNNICKRLDLKVYSQMPPFALFQIDHKLYVASYPKGKPVHNGTWIYLKSSTPHGQVLLSEFDNISRDPDDTFDISYCFFLSIKGAAFFYVKSENNFYIGLTDKQNDQYFILQNSLNTELKFYWFSYPLKGNLSEIISLNLDIIEVFERKFPNEKISRYYSIYCKETEEVFSTRRNLIL